MTENNSIRNEQFPYNRFKHDDPFWGKSNLGWRYYALVPTWGIAAFLFFISHDGKSIWVTVAGLVAVIVAEKQLLVNGAFSLRALKTSDVLLILLVVLNLGFTFAFMRDPIIWGDSELWVYIYLAASIVVGAVLTYKAFGTIAPAVKYFWLEGESKGWRKPKHWREEQNA